MAGQCCFRYPGNSPTVMPSIPGLPLFDFTRRKARFRFPLSQTSSITCSGIAGLSHARFAVSDSVPSRRAIGASLLPSAVKASTICNWFFCRLSPIVTRRRSPEVSSTAFGAQPPDLPPADLMDVGFAAFRPLARCRRPHHPVLVHRLAPLLHASFRPRLTTTPLRFAIPSPPSGWEEDFHLPAVEHARHTKKEGAFALLNWFCSRLNYFWMG